ncbi:MAG: hypothetical protein RLZZ347_441 [Candidatus Parcubacteria bacterium]|jgi:hypothetical protein
MQINPVPKEKSILVGLTSELREYLENISLKDFDGQQKVKDYVQSEINKIIFYLGTGTFVLSISFIGYLKNNLLHPKVLIVAWVCLALVILGQVIIHTLSKWVADKKQTLINKSRSSNFNHSWQDATTKDTEIIKWMKYASYLNIIILTLLLGGIIALLFFASSNLLYRN